MSRKKKLFRAAFAIITFVVVLNAFAVLFMMSAKQPKVVLLYTQREPIPDIAFKLSSVPLALTSYAKNFSLTFAALPATTENIRMTLLNAKFVVIGTHGWDGKIYSDEKDALGPTNPPNLKMRNIYFGSCFFGAKRKGWQATFPNAKIMGHDAETYALTGWFYLVFRSWIDLIKTDFN